MNAADLNKALVALIEKKAELQQLSYDDARYDDIEEALHDLEDDFNDDYGSDLEAALEKVHADLKSDTDVLLPTAYLPATLATHKDDGVWVDSEKYPGRVRLVLRPNPTRFVLTTSKGQEHELWTA
ncbi:MAG: hypothetical protein ACRYFX_26450 [Janthinobacterium lividum]